MRRWMLLGALLVATGACSYGEDPEPYRPPGIREAASRDGHELYLRDCAYCHGPEGKGATNGPDLVSGSNGPALTDFMLRTGRMPVDDPDEPLRHRASRYTEQEIEEIVDHVESFGGRGPDVPDPHPERGDVSLGMRLYQENCAACHSTTGIGGTLTEGEQSDVRGRTARRGGLIAPPILESTPVEIVEAMRTGPGTMPEFAVEFLSDEDVDAVVRYIQTLASDVDRGGASIGRVGPVAEGAMGLFIGLLAALIFARWIGGTRKP